MSKKKKPDIYIRKERYAGACSSSFYVGEEVKKEDIKAEFRTWYPDIICSKERSKTSSRTEKNNCH